MSGEMKFDLAWIEIPVEILGKQYLLREANEDAAVRYRAAAVKGARMVDGKAVIDDMTGSMSVEPLLVSLCLFRDAGDGKQVPVGLEVVRGFPSRVVRRLFQKVKEISTLEESEDLKDLERQAAKLQGQIEKLREDEGQRGNALGSTTLGSG